MRLEFSTVLPVNPAERTAAGWDRLGTAFTPPPSVPETPNFPPSETILSADTLRGMLIELGANVSTSSLALAEALAKLGVPITESTLAEGQAILARLPGINPAVFALTKALDLPPTPAIMKALNAVVDHLTMPSNIDVETLDILSILPQVSAESGQLADYLSRLTRKLGQSTENKLFSEPEAANTLSIYDARSALLGLAQTQNGGESALSADNHASYIEGQQLLNNVAMQKYDNFAPLYFGFPITLAGREVDCEIQVWSSKEKRSTDPIGADQEEYLRAVIRVEANRLGVVETTLVGMWSGRLLCTMAVAKPITYRLLKRESPVLAKSLGLHGWNVAPIDIVQKERFTPLWLGGDLLDNPRARVDKRI